MKVKKVYFCLIDAALEEFIVELFMADFLVEASILILQLYNHNLIYLNW